MSGGPGAKEVPLARGARGGGDVQHPGVGVAQRLAARIRPTPRRTCSCASRRARDRRIPPRVAWWGLGTRWLQYATLLSCSQACIRCETVTPAQAFFTFPDGRQEEAHRLNEEVASYFRVEDDELTPGLMMTADVGFDVEPGPGCSR